ncbi:hypothetical protein L1049_024662 [Liquidambar formosana]|uniref:Uncharacterized protein n=1 Tax=Liquidambar formosana TaxID=63359 RepID=A0AAP0RUW2_LIQFO
MESLKNLEEVQKVLLLMQSRGIIPSDSNHDSDRFIANLILLLLQPCGELGMDKKRHLVFEYLPRISSVFLEEASVWLSQEGCQQDYDKNISPLHCDEKIDFSSLQTDFGDMAVVGLDAMQRANSTLEDFCRSYYMFHELDVNRPQSIFRYLPVLSFTESFIYQLDSLNEKILNMPDSVLTVQEKGSLAEANWSYVFKSMQALKTDPFRPLVLLLERYGLLTERIREEFSCGEEYWALERNLCCALMSKKEISIEDVMRAIQLKSFDYRVLNLLLYQLRGEKVDNMHMEFLSASEFLVEVADDLFDYEDDVLENNFNILRMFVRIYGPSTAPTMLAKCISEAEVKYEDLLKTLDPQLSLNYQKRCEEATKEGGKMSEHALGTWNLPAVIADEELYRSNLLNSKLSQSSNPNILQSSGSAPLV